MNYRCPVCGYDELTQPPENFSICDSCGTEFESDDFDRTHAELRHDWISHKMPWFSRSLSAPKNWSPLRQLIIAGYGTDLTDHSRFREDLEFRSEVNKAFSEVVIAKQLKALRERDEEPLTQTQLANKAGMKQSRISELEGMNYSSWSISTLERLAKALGVGFSYSFVPWSELLSRIQQGVSAEALSIPSFDREMAITNIEVPYEEPAESYTGLRLRPSRSASDLDLDFALIYHTEALRLAQDLEAVDRVAEQIIDEEEDLGLTLVPTTFFPTSPSAENVTATAMIS